MSRAGIDRAATADGVALTFRDDAGVERELRELVAVENQCCPWARWEWHAVGVGVGVGVGDGDGDGDGDSALVMRARANRDGVGTLQSMFLRAA
jgi:hypothetical protein